MSNFHLSLNLVLRWMVSLSLTLAPFYGLPAPAQQQPQSATETEYSQGQRLLLDLEDLLDRALYPNVPRKVVAGAPTTSELNQIQSRLTKLKQSYTQDLLSRIESINDEQKEFDAAGELNTYFTDVQRFEGLKIILGLPSQEDKWDELYSLKFPIESLSQMKFVAMLSAQSDSFVPLPGAVINLERLAKLKESINGFQSRLEIENGQWTMKLRLDPAFADYYERTLFTTNLSTRNVLLYAIQWSAHRLYDSQALTLNLQRQQPMSSLPEPSQAMRQRFLSMRVKRAQVLQRSKRNANIIMKTQMLKAVLDALHAANAKKQGWMLDEDFVKAFDAAAANPDDHLSKNIDLARLDEQKNFFLSISSLINLMEVENWKTQAQYLVYEAARLATRAAFLVNADSHFELKPEARDGFVKYIDQKAQKVTEELMANGLAQAIGEVDGKMTAASVRDQVRQNFQGALLSASRKMQDFSHSAINFTYLLSSQKGAIDMLKPSAFVSSIVDSLESQHSYVLAYETYLSQLYTFMQAFKFPNELHTMNFETASKLAPDAIWNPNALDGNMDPAYIAALNEEATQRTQDLKTLIRIGEILKFDTFEKYVTTPRHKRHGVNKDVTPSALGMDETLLGSILGSDKQAYLEEMKKDLLKSAPILGGTVDSASQATVWETLNRDDLSSDWKYQMIDGQFAKVIGQIADDQARIDQALAKLDATPDDSINGATEDLRILITRTAQLSVGLDSFAGFDSYYEEVRGELLTPGFAGREWTRFASWTDTVSWYMMAFWALKAMVGPRVKAVGTVMDTAGKLLAPVLGTDLKHFNYLLFGVLGIAFGGKVTTYYQERSRAQVLRAFFECGTAAPCVALYSDLSLQVQRQQKALTDAVMTVATILAIYFGIRYAVIGANKLLMRDLSVRRTAMAPYLKRVGIDIDRTPLTRDNLDQAAATQIARVRADKNVLRAAAEEALIRHARKQLETAILDEAAYWAAQDARFAGAAKALGLDGTNGNWKSISALAGAWGRLKAQFEAGQISYFRYEQLMQEIVDMKNVLSPVYAQMRGNGANINFMEGVWRRGINKLQIEISASLEAQKSLNVSTEFEKAVSQFAGTSSSAATAERDAETNAMIEQVSKDLAENPTLAANRFQNLVGNLMKRANKWK